MVNSSPDFYQGVLDNHETATVVYEAERDDGGAIVDFRWVYANSAAKRILAHDHDHIAGRLVTEMLGSDLGERILRVNRRVVETGEPAETVVRFAHISRDAVFTINSAKHGDAVITTYRDITDRVSADRKLTEFATRLDIATRAAGIGVFERDLETGVSYWDAQTRKLHGLPPTQGEEISAELAQSMLFPEDIDATIAKMRLLEATGVFESRHRIMRPDGEIRWLQVFARSVAAARGRRLMGVCWDVTAEVANASELRGKARELALATERLSIAAEVADIGVWEFDVASQKFLWNKEMYAVYGMSPSSGEVSFRDWRERLHPEDAGAVKSEMARMLSERRDLDVRYRIVRPSGEVRHIRGFARVLGRAEDGRIIGASLDITPQVVAAEELARKTREAEAASEAKSRFLASMSHEIRTPMNGVLGMSQALAMTEVTDRQREMIDLIVRSGESLLSLLNDILDISRIEAGALSIDEETFHLGELARDVGALFRGRAEAAGVGFSVKVEPAADRLMCGDELRVRQILNNLVSNAIKFTEHGEVKVRVGIAPETGEVELEVADTGVGIAPEQLERVFEAFVQADDSNTRRFGGSGLGLSIVRRLAEAMGGGAFATSELGRGSVFTVRLRLPAVEGEIAPLKPAAAAELKPEPESEAAEPRPWRVLVAEDNTTNQRVMEAMLAPTGIEITFANDGREAVSAWEADVWDAILMDVSMPVMDGVQAAKAIRARERETGRARTPIVAVTANVMPHQLETYRAAGMDAHVSKPIDCAELIETVREAAAGPEARRASA